jgi:hypothetical protein
MVRIYFGNEKDGESLIEISCAICNSEDSERNYVLIGKKIIMCTLCVEREMPIKWMEFCANEINPFNEQDL